MRDLSFKRKYCIEYADGGKAGKNIVMFLGHSIPWAGHLGRQKILAQIRRRFYWPGLRADEVKLCKTCPEC